MSTAPPPDGVDAGDPHPQVEDDLRRSSFLVGAGILLSRISGLIREVVTAAFLATGVGAEAFKAALRIPNLLQNLLGEGVLSASFVPAYSKLLAEGRREEAGRLAGAIAGLLLVLTSGLVLVGVVFAEPITRLLTPGFVPGTDRFDLTVMLVRIITPGVGFLVLSAWCLGVLNSHRRFFLSYVAPVLWNVAIIGVLAGAALVSTDQARLATAMAVGAAVGSVLQFAVQLPSVIGLTRGLALSTSFAVPGVPEVVRRFGQVVAGRGGVQLASYVDLAVASLLAFGAFSALTYAQVLYLLPISLFGMSVAAAELPTLSTMDRRDRPRIVARLDEGLGRVAFFVVPSSIAFLLAGDLIAATVFQWRAFSPEASVQVGIILAVYALGMLASTSSRLLQSALYGAGDTRTPAIYAVMRVVLSLIVGVSIMFPLDAFGVTAEGVRLIGDLTWSIAPEGLREGPDSFFRLGATGLAFGAAVGAWFELLLLRIRVGIVFGRPRLAGPHARAIAKAAVAGVVGAGVARVVVGATGVGSRLGGIIAVLVIGGAYLLAARVLGVPEAAELTGRVERRLRRR
ncbi:murein biosynthesis integral membrane protein MurJ [Nitriliruptor alkaliphilus]|uniref:murein biosynthesis integral membrane protein MurJ n=1 Tax=Nitriliruptor alkaliphilus TaxID=427918 RepID=UPI000698E341|nr:murein biosynthesis integral membrane protein MurJ [Nitriliruptor alkaliphilus]